MAFGKTFFTLKEARAEIKRVKDRDCGYLDLEVRKLSKKLFPRTKKRYHVGTYIDWLNW